MIFSVKRYMGIIAVMLLLYSTAYGMQIISPVEGETSFIEISKKDLNVIKTSFSGAKAISSSRSLDVKVEGKNIFVKYTGSIAEPQELIITDTSGSIYPLVLKPTGIPAETIVLRTRDDAYDAFDWERSHGYTRSIKELIKNMYIEVPPRGYTVDNLTEDATEWNEVTKTLKKRYAGALLSGEVYALKARAPVALDEKEFYKENTLAVSIEKHALEANETTKLYIVKRRAGKK